MVHDSQSCRQSSPSVSGLVTGKRWAESGAFEKERGPEEVLVGDALRDEDGVKRSTRSLKRVVMATVDEAQ